jgi:hypothetical protein
VTIEAARKREGQQEVLYFFSRLPPWWKKGKPAPDSVAQRVPKIELELRFIELPNEAPISPDQTNLDELKKITGVDIYSVPRITASSGEECEINTAKKTTADALATTPHGIIGRVRPFLDGETVHYAFKFSLSKPSASLDAGRTEVQETVRNGNARLNQPLLLDLGIGEKGRRQLVWMVFHGR